MIGSIPGHEHGHIAMYNGRARVSDFRRPADHYPSTSYRRRVAPVAFHRHPLADAAGLMVDPAPDAVARDFYRWHLREMAARREPGDDPRTYGRSSTAASRGRIKRMMASPDGLVADYFLQAQDFLEDKPSHIVVGVPAVRGSVSRAIVTLGQAQPYRLSVKLRREAGVRRIDAVSAA